MKLEDQVIYLEHAKKLKKLGVKQESHFHWGIRKSKGENITYIYKNLATESYCDLKDVYDEVYSAFTVAELGEMLTTIDGGLNVTFGFGQLNADTDNKWVAKYYLKESGEIYCCADINEANSRAEMLIHLIENKLVEV